MKQNKTGFYEVLSLLEKRSDNVMKKFISVLTCLCLLLSFTTVWADNQKVDGLHEKLEAIRFDKNFTPEQIEEINQHWLNDFNEYFWNDFLPGIKKVGKTRTDNDEDEYKYWLNYNMPDYSNGVLTVSYTHLLKTWL